MNDPHFEDADPKLAVLCREYAKSDAIIKALKIFEDKLNRTSDADYHFEL